MGGLVFLGSALLLAVYIRVNDARLGSIPEDALIFSPKRCTPETIRSTAAAIAKAPPISLRGQLPPKTGRRYIVVGGVRARLPRWASLGL